MTSVPRRTVLSKNTFSNNSDSIDVPDPSRDALQFRVLYWVSNCACCLPSGYEQGKQICNGFNENINTAPTAHLAVQKNVFSWASFKYRHDPIFSCKPWDQLIPSLFCLFLSDLISIITYHYFKRRCILNYIHGKASKSLPRACDAEFHFRSWGRLKAPWPVLTCTSL